MFSCEIYEIFKNSLFYRTPQVATPIFGSVNIFLFSKIQVSHFSTHKFAETITHILYCNWFEVLFYT